MEQASRIVIVHGARFFATAEALACQQDERADHGIPECPAADLGAAQHTLRLPHQYPHTLKKMAVRDEHLSEFVNCYNPQNRPKRKAT